MNTLYLIGMGPGVGQAIAQRFAREGFALGLIARRAAALADHRETLAAQGVRVATAAADAADPEALLSALAALQTDLGVPSVLVYNAITHTRGGALALPPTDFERELRVNVVGALAAARFAAERMPHGGTIAITGGGLAFAPSAQVASLSVGKAAVRALALTLHQELAPRGIHAGTVTIGGYVGSQPSLSAANVAAAFWRFHQQSADAADAEIVVR